MGMRVGTMGSVNIADSAMAAKAMVTLLRPRALCHCPRTDASNCFDVTFQSPNRIEIACNMHARRSHPSEYLADICPKLMRGAFSRRVCCDAACSVEDSPREAGSLHQFIAVS